ncbi:MAG: hypothetical protein FJ206_06790 [Gemmatimonadetes bacterium]|nr:hypothetical protein [Gemmatimonadota bacterium]
MSKYLFVAAAVALAACGEKKADAPVADTAAAAAPAPATTAPADSAAMSHDSTAMAGDSAKAH